MENCYVSKGGETAWVHKFISVLRDERGALTHLVALVTDVTERRCTEETLCKADRHKNDFLAILAHELRNPLVPIPNAVQTLSLQGPTDPRLQAARDMINQQVKQMVRLIDDRLDVSRITCGKLELRHERVLLLAILEQALDASRPKIVRIGHKLTVLLPPGPLALNADPVRLVPVFQSLLSNASKHSDPDNRIWLTAVQDGTEVDQFEEILTLVQLSV